MTKGKNKLVSSGAATGEDAEAIRFFRDAIAGGQHWYIALLGSIGLWSSASEVHDERSYQYLIEGEAFDWLLLAERLCGTVNGIIPEDERDALLFHGMPPLQLTAAEVKNLIGEKKYAQYLNYFYGVTVEEALVLAMQEEIDKERLAGGIRSKRQPIDEPCLRIYDATREALLEQYRREKRSPALDSTSLTELEEFTYWLFKYRLKRCEKARVASDTKKALDFLKRRWRQRGVSWVLASDVE